ncbi:sugar transferase [Thalassoroseus pseudoceratinae]|uniref:sugar transferase n=1 Tax=Thalassoroseus pseudoceratinae TaxID=2713176 RepID=UPI00141EE3B4|nr:sugar transferase [Thalassoroseus pseudoceratinae]
MLTSSWQRFFNRRQTDICTVPGILSTTEFKQALSEERVRTERTKIGFCLLAFKSKTHDSPSKSLFDLQIKSKERLRILDKVGWLDRDTLGVLMPITKSHDAIRVAKEICESLRKSSKPVPDFEIFSYPLSDTEMEDQDTTKPNDSDIGQKILADCDELQKILSEEIDKSCQSSEQTKAMVADEETEERDCTIHSMDRLFLKPMPIWKRSLDIVGASIGLVLTSPILLASMIAIRATSPGPAIFSQYRTGLAGRRFKIYKLRSMVTDAEARKKDLMALNEQDGPAFKIASDPRVTTVGRIIRATSIDELPQLWNVLKGDMSLVGPRPLPCNETESCHGWLRRRLDVTPGLTCGWQTQPQRNQITFDDWTRMDVQYIQERSILTDLKHVWRTFGVVLGRRSV